MIEIFICEDNKEQLNKLNEYISNYILIENLDMKIVLSTDSPDKVIEYVKQSGSNGLYFFDIDLRHDINGISLGAEIRKYDPNGNIVFITTHSELTYLTFMYKVSAMDFIIKDDFSTIQDRVISCIKVVNERNNSDIKDATKKFVLKMTDKVISVNYCDIMFFESSPTLHKVILHLDNRQIEFYGKLKDIEKSNECLVRAHNSYLINIDNVQEINLSKKEIVLTNGEVCFSSSRLIKSVQKALEKRNISI